MINIPNPWISDSACIADTLIVPCDAPIQCTVSEVIPVSDGAAYRSLPLGEIDPSVMLDFAPSESEPARTANPIRAATAADVATRASAAFSFQPDFEQMLEFIWRDFHPRDLDLDTPIAFLHNPSDEYLQALQQLAGSRRRG